MNNDDLRGLILWHERKARRLRKLADEVIGEPGRAAQRANWVVAAKRHELTVAALSRLPADAGAVADVVCDECDGSGDGFGGFMCETCRGIGKVAAPPSPPVAKVLPVSFGTDAEGRPMYLAPTPPADDARDAARLDWLEAMVRSGEQSLSIGAFDLACIEISVLSDGPDERTVGTNVRDAIDNAMPAALSATPAPRKEPQA